MPTPFVPTQDEIENSRQETTQAQRVKATQKPIRSRGWRCCAFGISGQKAVKSGCTNSLARRAIWRAAKKSRFGFPSPRPSGCRALLRRADADDAYGLRVWVQDMGRPRAVDFDRAELARLGASEIRARLLEAGLRVEADGEAVVVQAESGKAFGLHHRRLAAGWHRLPEPVFVTPAGETIGAPEGVRIELAATVKTLTGFPAPARSRAGKRP